MNCSFTEKISPLIDGELSTSEAREVERHVVTCAECQQLRADFLSLRNQITRFESSLEPQVQNRALKKILTPSHPAPVRGLQWSFGTQAAAFAALVIAVAIVGLLLFQSFNQKDQDGRQATVVQTPSSVPAASAEPSKQPEAKASPEPARGNEPQAPTGNKNNDEKQQRREPAKRPIVREPKPGEQFASVPERLRSADAETMTALHFEKSETLLRSFRNVRLDEPGAAAEVSYERQRARQLVVRNMMLRREADANGDVQISTLLENLEPILIDIANLPDQPDEDAVRTIRERVERKNIVALLQVNSAALARALD